MQSRLFLNIFLFLVIIGLVLFLSRTTNNINEQDTPLTQIIPESIQNIKIIRRDLEEISFSKKDNQWMMQTPYEVAANKLRISTMLNLLQAYSYTQLDSNDVELDRFLLDDPVVSIQFDDIKIDLGDTNPLGEDKLRYVRLNNTIHLINDSLYQQLLTNASFFISPKLLPEDSNIKALYFPEYNIQLVDATWKLDPDTYSDVENISNMVNAWHDVEAITVRKFSGVETNNKISIEFERSQPIEFLIVSPLPNLILARPEFSVQYHISSNEAGKLFIAENKNTETAEQLN